MRHNNKPSCTHGYTTADLHAIIGADLTHFNQWMTGQTCIDCTAYDERCTDPHGIVRFESDVEAYLRGNQPTTMHDREYPTPGNPPA